MKDDEFAYLIASVILSRSVQGRREIVERSKDISKLFARKPVSALAVSTGTHDILLPPSAALIRAFTAKL